MRKESKFLTKGQVASLPFLTRSLKQKEIAERFNVSYQTIWVWTKKLKEEGKWDKPNKNPENCICAAIRASDGSIVRCHRHNDGLRTLRDIPGKEYEYGDKGCNQGFVTSSGRYVTREEGYLLQITAGIPSVAPTGYIEGDLYSEDLY